MTIKNLKSYIGVMMVMSNQKGEFEGVVAFFGIGVPVRTGENRKRPATNARCLESF